MPLQTPMVSAGSVVLLRLFDIAYAIELAQLQPSVDRSSSDDARRGVWMERGGKLALDVVQLPLSELDVPIGGDVCRAVVSARLYDFGVAAISVRLTTSRRDWSGFVDWVGAVDRAMALPHASAIWADLMDRLNQRVAAALRRPNRSALQQSYLLAVVDAFEPARDCDWPWQDIDLAPLLSGDPRPLCGQARSDLMRRSFCHRANDVVVLAPRRAFVHEPDGPSGVIDVLEAAHARLLELRYYEGLLNEELPRMYAMVAQTRRTVNVLAPRRLADLARKLYALVAEVTELTEKVESALQVSDDAHLARLYAAALKLLHVPALGAAVDRKLSIIRDTYAALYDEAAVSRAGLLELTIIVLIAAEIVMALVQR